MEKDVERDAASPTESSVHKDEHEDGGSGSGGNDTEIEPIRPGSSAARSSRSVGRTRSNNGYGCDDGDGDGEQPLELTQSGASARDPFEVGWENGDQDPLCPRSMKKWRKWTIVIVTSCGSFCV